MTKWANVRHVSPIATAARNVFNLVWLTAMALLLLACGPAASQQQAEPTLTVFAAASTSDAMTRLAQLYETTHGVRVRLSLAASSTLARQIEQGAQADLYISASQSWLQYLEDGHYLLSDSKRTLLTNRLALITANKDQAPIRLAADFKIEHAFSGRLALGDPSHVPAGLYAEQALRSLTWWQRLNHRLVPAGNVREALRWVVQQECELGIVYQTDAIATADVTLLHLFPQSSHHPIHYPVAVCKNASPLVVNFYAFLFSDQARALYAELGFGQPEALSDESVARLAAALASPGE